MPDIISGRQTLFVGAGTVNAYVNFSGLAADSVTLSPDGKLTVRLPEAPLEKPNLDHDRSYVVSQQRGVLDRISDFLELPEQTEFYKQAEKQMTEAGKSRN